MINQNLLYLKEKARLLPSVPGIYLMKDYQGNILYVGKAKALNQRVASYFQKNAQHTKRILRLIHTIADFETITVDTELDALLLECKYIQKYHPSYNRQMNFSSNYRYLLLDNHGYQLLEKKQIDGFGPFRLTKKVPEIYQLLEETYQLDSINPYTRLLLQKQLPQISQMSNEWKMQELHAFFAGEPVSVFDLISQRITYLADKWQFEAAQTLTKQLKSLRYFYHEIQELNAFVSEKYLCFQLPLNNDMRKYYQVSYGRIVLEKKLSKDAPLPDFVLQEKPAELSLTDLDPLRILISYLKQHSLSIFE